MDENHDGRLARELLERAANAFPALVDESRRGWRLRHTDNSTWWAGAVLAHSGTDEDSLEDGIATAEEFYASQGAPPRFQICPGCPAGLDQLLARRGYRMATAMSLQVADTASVCDLPAAPGLAMDVTGLPDTTWFATWRAVHAVGVEPEPEWRLLRRVRRPSGYVTVRADGEAVAVGRAVAEGGWAGVFAMATLPHARRRGLGRSVLGELARWAVDHRSDRMYLQLEHDNPAAQRLYTSAGFTERFAYHYRVR